MSMRVPPTADGADRRDGISLRQGSGGEETRRLMEERFLPRLSGDLADTAVVEVNAREIALSTNTFVVSPVEFPGGNVGTLAVNGTLNDLCTAGASPSHLSVGFVLEEGFAFDALDRILEGIAGASRRAGVRVVAGDTKVVERGRADGVFINTTGVGILDRDFRPSPERATPGDVVVVTGPVGRHAAAVLAARGELDGVPGADGVTTDSANLFPLLERLRNTVAGEIHALRDPTVGGLSGALLEIARAAKVGIEVDVDRLPVSRAVSAACSALGADPLRLCSAGVLAVVLPAACAEEILPVLHGHPLGRDATVVGTVSDDHPGEVVVHRPGEPPADLRTPADLRFTRIC